MNPLPCDDARRLLHTQLDSELNEHEFAALESHLKRCADCVAAARDLYRLDLALSRSLAQPLVDDIARRVSAQLADEASKRTPSPFNPSLADRTKARPPAQISSRQLLGLVVVASLIVAITWVARQYTAKPAAMAHLAVVRGEVFVTSPPSGNRSVGRSGTALQAGVSVESVGLGSSATIVFADGTRVELGGDTHIAECADAASESAATFGKRLRLVSGQLTADVAPQPVGRPMLIMTPHAEAQVLGTVLALSESGSSTWMDVDEGAVQITNVADRRSLVVNTGESAVVAAGTLQRAGDTPFGNRPNAEAVTVLPASGTTEHPLVLLEAEPNPASALQPPPHTIVVPGRIGSSSGVDYACARRADVVVAKKGQAATRIELMFRLPDDLVAGPYRLQTKLMYGGDYPQTLSLDCGADLKQLRTLAVCSVRNPTAWQSAWIKSTPTLTLNADDRWLRITAEGTTYDAKVFDAFLLVPRIYKPSELPTRGTVERPALLLEAETFVGPIADAALRVWPGEVIAHEGDEFTDQTETGVSITRKGQHRSSVTLRYTLQQGVAGGDYRFWARYMAGGDQPQTFVVRAGPSADRFSSRGTFTLHNAAAWKQAWLTGGEPIALRSDDRVIEVESQGNAFDGKVFDAFLLSPP